MRVFVELDVEDAVLALLLDRRRAAPTAVSLPASSPPPRALDQEQRWLRVKEAARYASVSTSTIYDAWRVANCRTHESAETVAYGYSATGSTRGFPPQG